MEAMDTTETPAKKSPNNNIIKSDKITIRKAPYLLVYTYKGHNLTKTINTCLGNNPNIDMDRFLKNLLICLTKTEQGIEEDKESGKLKKDKNARQRRYQAAVLAAEHTWKGMDSEEYFKKAKTTPGNTPKAKKGQSSNQKGSKTLDNTVDLVSPNEEEKTKKRKYDDLDTDYSSDDDSVPATCDEKTRVIIKLKNKKIITTKKLLKGAEARNSTMKQEVRDIRGQFDEEKTKHTKEKETLTKTIQEINAEKLAREKDLADKEIKLNIKERKIEEEEKKLVNKEKKIEEDEKNGQWPLT